MAAQAWKPHDSLTKAPTNLKEAIDWVLRVTGRDGKKNEAASPPQFGCICFLAKAVKDLLYDARSPGTPGPSTGRYWDDILLDQEQSIVKPVLTDLGLLSSDKSNLNGCGATEVIKTLIDHTAQGLQKFVGWGDGGCCVGEKVERENKKGDGGSNGGDGKKKSTGIGGTCMHHSGGAHCGNGNNCTWSGSDGNKCCIDATNCYLSAYCKNGGTGTNYLWPTLSDKADQVHLLARILLGSVCLIWSGLSQLGFLTKEGSGSGGNNERWKEGNLHEVGNGLGSFMAAMGYDLERLNGSGGSGKNGKFVHELLTGKDKDKGVPWKEFTKESAEKNSVAEYYSTIYGTAQGAVKDKKTEDICKQYPLLVLHILASGYFRAGSAGAKGVTTPPKAPSSDPKKDTTPRKPRTIREILYWLSALPYSEKYRELVERMQSKMDGILPKEEQQNQQNILQLHGEGNSKTELKKNCITHYLMAACGYCPLVLIGIQGTIEKEVKQEATAGSGGVAAGTDDKRCPEHKKDPSAKRCTLEDANKAASAAPAAPAPSPSTGEPLKDGEVCYGGYHLEVSKFGPLHGMYANGLFGFDMDLSAAQCLDHLRIYVYHCFYQLYFLRKQCGTGVVAGDKAVLGWKSCRYGSGVNPSGGVSNQNPWRCEAQGSGQDCQCKKTAGHQSPLMYFLCDGLGPLVCKKTVGVGLGSNKQSYPEIDAHMNKTVDSKGKEHEPHRQYPQLCPVPMGWSAETGTGNTQQRENHFKDLKDTHKTAELSGAKGQNNKYPAHCTGRTLSHLLEYYCDPEKCHGALVVLLRLLACITPTVPRTLGDLFGFYYYIVYIGGQSASGGEGVNKALGIYEKESKLHMASIGGNEVVEALTTWNNSGKCSGGTQDGTLKCLYKCDKGNGSQYLSPLSGQQYGQLSPLMAGTYLSWLVYLIEGFKTGLEGLKGEFKGISCKDSECKGGGGAGGTGCGGDTCKAGSHGTMCSGNSAGVCGCTSVVSCTGVLPVLYKYGFGYGDVKKLHDTKGADSNKKCHDFLGTLEKVLTGDHLKKGSKGNLHHEINKLIYTTRLPWIFVLTLAWLVAVLYLAFGAIWPLDWTHMRSHCRGWFRKGSLSPWEILMVGKKKGRGILEFFGKT